MTYTYEPIYNQVRTKTDPRGTDPNYRPPIPLPGETYPNPQRYTTVSYFDYQESAERAVQAPDDRLAMDGSGRRVNQSPLIQFDPNVLTTEVWLVEKLGLPEDTTGAGLVELRGRLSGAGVQLGLGDLNGDGDTTPTVQGNVVRITEPTVHLLPGSNEAAIEGSTLQPIVGMFSYNQFGQMARRVAGLPTTSRSTN
jgi:hypothetical protein